MNFRIPSCLVFFIFSLILPVAAQTTINLDEKKSEKNITKKHKVLLIPFDQKMYMSEIDHVINTETKKNHREIKWTFKDKIDQVLYDKFKAKYEVVSLVEDTLKSNPYLKMIYSGIGYKYDKVPAQKDYQAPKSDYKQDGKVKNGQIITVANKVPRFMNAKLNDKLLLEKLNKKYQTDVFVFINQLDLKSAASDGDSFGSEKQRQAILHYTVFDLQGKELNSGVAECNFPKNQNDPDKISTTYIDKALNEIYSRVDKALNPVSTVTGK